MNGCILLVLCSVLYVAGVLLTLFVLLKATFPARYKNIDTKDTFLAFWEHIIIGFCLFTAGVFFTVFMYGSCYMVYTAM